MDQDDDKENGSSINADTEESVINTVIDTDIVNVNSDSCNDQVDEVDELDVDDSMDQDDDKENGSSINADTEESVINTVIDTDIVNVNSDSCNDQIDEVDELDVDDSMDQDDDKENGSSINADTEESVINTVIGVNGFNVDSTTLFQLNQNDPLFPLNPLDQNDPLFPLNPLDQNDPLFPLNLLNQNDPLFPLNQNDPLYSLIQSNDPLFPLYYSNQFDQVTNTNTQFNEHKFDIRENIKLEILSVKNVDRISYENLKDKDEDDLLS